MWSCTCLHPFTVSTRVELHKCVLHACMHVCVCVCMRMFVCVCVYYVCKKERGHTSLHPPIQTCSVAHLQGWVKWCVCVCARVCVCDCVCVTVRAHAPQQQHLPHQPQPLAQLPSEGPPQGVSLPTERPLLCKGAATPHALGSGMIPLAPPPPT